MNRIVDQMGAVAIFVCILPTRALADTIWDVATWQPCQSQNPRALADTIWDVATAGIEVSRKFLNFTKAALAGAIGRRIDAYRCVPGREYGAAKGVAVEVLSLGTVWSGPAEVGLGHGLMPLVPVMV